MKKCLHCGCYNQDARVICADCGKTLTGANKVVEAEFNKELNAKLEKMSRYSDPFSFKLRYKVVFYASIPLIGANIALITLSLIELEMAVVAIYCFIMCIPFARFPKAIWKIEKLRLQFWVNNNIENIEPSDWWFITREIAIFGFFGAGVICFLYGLINNSPMTGAGTVYSTYII